MGKLFEELKRRKVFRVAAVYAVIAWVLIQVAETILPALQLPDWTVTFFIVFFILGFPIAVILAWAYEATPEGIRADLGIQTAAQAQAPQNQFLIYATFILVLLAVGFQLVDRFLFSPAIQQSVTTTASSISRPSRRFSINIGPAVPPFGAGTRAQIALSADGNRLVYSTRRNSTERTLSLKYLDQSEERELLAGASLTPFFSTDGEWVGFFAGVLNKVSVRGGAPQLLSESAQGGRSGAWSDDDTIFYSTNQGQLEKISANGGEPERLNIERANANSWPSWAYLLPGDDAVMYTLANTGSMEGGRIDVLTLSTGAVTTIIRNGYNARYALSGHIVFVRDESLWAVPFDAKTLQVTGQERPVVQGVETDSASGSTTYAFSDDGLLVYLPGGDTKAARAQTTTLTWVDRDGNEEVLPQVRNYRRWVVSPDGQRIAVSIAESDLSEDIWIYDLTRSTVSRLTFGGSRNYRPVWTPDGERVAYASDRDGGGLWWRRADGTGEAELLLADNDRSGGGVSAYVFTPNGATLLYWSGQTIYTLTPEDEVPSKPLIQSEFNERRPDVSPDGRWIAYGSNETGRMEIYVRPFPNVSDGKWQISNNGGDNPIWSPDGLELFFTRMEDPVDDRVWVTRRESTDSFLFDRPILAIESSDVFVSAEDTFDISADGSRLLLRKETESADVLADTLLVAVDNWFEELKRLAPPDPQ